MTAKDVYAIIEIAVSHIVLKPDETVDREASYFEGYLQVSGLRARIDLAADPGERIMELWRADGSELDRNAHGTFSVCSTEELLSGSFNYPTYPYRTLATEWEALTAYLRNRGTVGIPADAGRMQFCGSRAFFVDNGRVIGGLIAVFGILITVFLTLLKRRIRNG